MPEQDTSGFFGQAVPSVKWVKKGQIIRGTVTAKEMRPDVDPETKKVATFPDGTPKPLVVLTLTSEQWEGKMRLWIRGWMQNAFRAAVADGGFDDLYVGSDIEVMWNNTDPPKVRGFKGARHFAVTIALEGDEGVITGHGDSAAERDKKAGSDDDDEEPTEEPPF
jgi:hypothetical protein